MEMFMYLLPVIMLLFAIFFGYISFSILVRKKPVVVAANILVILMAVGFLPSIIINVVLYFTSSASTPLNLFVSAMFLALLVFYFFMIRGISIYGMKDDDFRSCFLDALGAAKLSYTETMNKIHIEDPPADIFISFQESLGSGMVKMKGKAYDSFKQIVRHFKIILQDRQVVTKKATAIFYIVFTLLMLGSAVALLYIATQL